MTPQEAKTVANYLIADFESEMPTTLGVIAAASDGKLDYQPDAKSKSGLGLVRHIVLEDEWLINCIADGAFVPPPDDSDACGIMTPADGVARYKERIPAAVARLKTLSGEKLLEDIDMMGMMKFPALNYISVLTKHLVHHRGQLSAYLRAMGGKVPGIYGPSADTQ